MNQAEMLMTLGAIRQIELQRAATGLLRDLLAELEALSLAASRLAMEFPLPPLRKVSSQRKAVRELAETIGDLTDSVMAELRRRTEEFVDQIAPVTADDERANFLAVFGLSLAGVSAVSSGNLLVRGATVADHFKEMAGDLKFRVRAEIQESVMAGEAEETLYWRLRGRELAEGPPGEFRQTRRAVESLVRTAAVAVPNAVQLELAPRANVVGATGWQHVSVLDNRTTDICRGRAWKKWDAKKAPVGHALPFRKPPLHDNCRSRVQLIFLDDPEPPHVTFKAWVESFTPEQRDALFGRRNVQAWKAGRITDAEMLRQQNRPLSTAELRERTKRKTDGQSQFPFLE